jgi:hypothetical protein
MENKHEYEEPRIVDYGDIKELTATNGEPNFTDVPLGTPVVPGVPIIGIS